jgi:nucleoid-associated protein YgaU
MDTKKLLKSIKLHETQISVILGIIILIIAGIFVVRYVRSFKNQNPTQIQKAASTQNKEQTHKVEKGESLWKIAEKYLGKGSDWKKIADANNISTPSEIEVGQSLIIPALALDSPQPVAVESPTPKPQITKEAASIDASIKENSYTVEKGDSLWKIAVRAYGDG